MQTAIIIIVLVLILIVVLAYYMRERHFRSIDTLNQLKIDVYNNEIDHLLAQADEVKFAGASKQEFENVKKQWVRVQEENFPILANAIFEAEKATETMNFMEARQQEKEAEAHISETNKEIFGISKKINAFLEAAENNQQEIAQMHDQYEKLRNKLLVKSFNYGSTVGKIDNIMRDIENEFNVFQAQATSGDHVKAYESLDRIKAMIKKTTTLMRQIPKDLKKVVALYPEELEQIRSGYYQLKSKNIAFPKDTILTDADRIQKQLQEIYDYIGDLDLAEAHIQMKQVRDKINGLFDKMEKEYQAYTKVHRAFDRLTEVFEVLYERNYQIKIETDRMSQIYYMSDSTLSYGSRVEQDIASKEVNFQKLRNDVTSNTIIYSQVDSIVEGLFDDTQSIYNRQEDFLSRLYGLGDQEIAIKDQVDDYVQRMTTLRQRLDRSNLPGANDNFYDLYMYTTGRIKDLADELDKVRVNMDEVEFLYDIVSQDVPKLEKTTNDMIWQGQATEQIIQSLNKYLIDFPDLVDKLDMIQHYYYTEHNYESAFNLAAESLNKIDPAELDAIQQRFNVNG